MSANEIFFSVINYVGMGSKEEMFAVIEKSTER